MARRRAWEARESTVRLVTDPARQLQFLDVLYVGQCEPLKAAVHGLLLGTAALCVLYNGAAWLRRRDRHLAINTVLYSLVVGWEHVHVRQHLACRPPAPVAAPRTLPDAA